MTGARKSNWVGYTYAGSYPWQKRNVKGTNDISFDTSPAKDCVVVIKTSESIAPTRFFRCVSEFKALRDQLARAVDRVEVWNDMDIPDTSFSSPISVTCHMGSLRMYVRSGFKVVRLNRHHCTQILYMFDKALADLEEWDAKMREIYGDSYIAMPREFNGGS